MPEQFDLFLDGLIVHLRSLEETSHNPFFQGNEDALFETRLHHVGYAELVGARNILSLSHQV